ncbi:hypothetical protein CCP1ISM_140019 [Azospirillaceae bacterium]
MSKYLDLPRDYVRATDISRLGKIDGQRLTREIVSGGVPFERFGNGKGYYATHICNIPAIERRFGVRIDANQIRH